MWNSFKRLPNPVKFAYCFLTTLIIGLPILWFPFFFLFAFVLGVLGIVYSIHALMEWHSKPAWQRKNFDDGRGEW